MSEATGTGVIVPLLTPINEDESVNFEQLGRLVEHVVGGGADGLLAMGSTGEFARFEPETRGNIIAEIVQRATVDAFNRINASRGDWMSPNIWRKRVLRHMGICDDRCTMPYLPVDEAADAEVRNAVEIYARMFA